MIKTSAFRLLFIPLSLLILFTLSGCKSSDPDQNANELYVQAIKYDAEMRKRKQSYSDIYASYKVVKENIEHILSEYPSSNLAVRLSASEAIIGGLSLQEFLNLGSRLELLAEAESNLFSTAILVSGTIDSETQKSYSLLEVSRNYINAGMYDLANELLTDVFPSVKKAYLFIDWADNYIERGEKKRTDQMLERARDTLVKAKSKRGGDGLLLEIATRYALVGRSAEANKLFEQLFRKYEQTYFTKKTVTTDISLRYRAGDFANASKFDYALKLARKIDSPSHRANALASVASAYIEKGDNNNAYRILQEAVEASSTVEYSDELAMLVAKFAVIYSKLDEHANAANLFTFSIEAAESLETMSNKAKVLANIAVRYAEAGERDKASQTFVYSIKTAQKSADDHWASQALEAISNKCIESNFVDLAVQALSLELELVNKSPSIEKTDYRLSGIAKRLARNGLLDPAIKMTKTMANSQDTIEVFIEIAKRYAENGDLLESEKLLEHAIKATKTLVSEFGSESEKRYKSDLLGEIAVVYSESEQVLSREAKVLLKDIVHRNYPIETFWK